MTGMGYLFDSAALVARAFRIANAAVISDIESEGVRQHDRTGGRWYDVRPMVDPHEHSPEVIDMNNEAIAYALAAGLITADLQHAHLVRINPLKGNPRS